MITLLWFLASQCCLAILVWTNTEMPMTAALWGFSAMYPMRLVVLRVWDEIDDGEDKETEYALF